MRYKHINTRAVVLLPTMTLEDFAGRGADTFDAPFPGFQGIPQSAPENELQTPETVTTGQALRKAVRRG